MTDIILRHHVAIRLNLMRLQGGLADPVEQSVSLLPGVRWWRGAGADILRAPNGAYWIILPLGFAKWPPAFVNPVRNEPDATIAHIVHGGGAVIPGEAAGTLEQRLVGT